MNGPRDIHAYLAELKDIPGTRVFTAARARRGYHLNRFAMSLMRAENRERWKTDERAYPIPTSNTCARPGPRASRWSCAAPSARPRTACTGTTTCPPETLRLGTSCSRRTLPKETDIKIALAGAGAFGEKHLDALKLIDGVEVISLVGGGLDATRAVAAKYGVGHACTELSEALEQPGLDAVILATPTQMHAAQAVQCLEAGKHVQVEIPLCDSLAGGEAVLAKQLASGLVAMVGHTRRFNPSHQYIHGKIAAGQLNIQQMDVQTYFFRRQNINAKGGPRSWTDHLLWHHAAHTVDLFAYQAGPIVQANAIAGPLHPELGIAMDMSIHLKAESGAICTLSLSFNNDGPLGTLFRYICDNGTWIARYDDLVTGREEPVDLSGVAISNNGIELQDREFVSAIREGREPNASVAQVMPCYHVLDALERELRA
jgi:2-hydroxy-4-carboxymuconate semialdehyde hemiacetal dehydrogenase